MSDLEKEWTKESIRELRLRLGLSRSDMARQLSIGIDILENIESGNDSILTDLSNQLTQLSIHAELYADEIKRSVIVEQIFSTELSKGQVEFIDLIERE